MFSRSSLLFTTLAAASMAVAGPLEARKALATSCLPAGVEASCYNLVSSCLLGVTSSTKSSIWHNRSCISAATCFGVGNLETSLACQLNTAVTNQEQASLDYNIYATIVGDCAWAAGGCPITQQNFIDFYYGSLTAINSGSFPTSPNTVISWWQSIASWTATGDTIPYTNFNDWLHYSTYPSAVTSENPITSTSTVAPITITSSTVAPITITSTSVAPVTTSTQVAVTSTTTAPTEIIVTVTSSVAAATTD